MLNSGIHLFSPLHLRAKPVDLSGLWGFVDDCGLIVVEGVGTHHDNVSV